MPSFFGLNIAIGALRANQYAMDVTVHNIANAETEGYHRQNPVFRAGTAIIGMASVAGSGIPQLGTGVDIGMVQRAQTDHIDGQVRLTNQWLGLWGYKNESLKQVETMLSEPSALGLSDSLNKFWNSWDDLSTSTESLPARVNVVQNGVTLAQKITTLYRDLRNMQAVADQAAVDNADQINRLAYDIAKLNKEIQRSSKETGTPNDLIDQRDLLVDQLSKIIQIDTAGGTGGQMIISIGGTALVQGDLVSEVTIAEASNGWSELRWGNDNTAVKITGGELAGQIQMRDDVLSNYIDSLNTIAKTIVDRVNALHTTGITSDGQPADNFFTPGTDASNMSVNSSLISNASGVAASTTGNSGANELALAISGVRSEKLIGNQTIDGAYSDLVGRIGAQSREADSRYQTHGMSLQQLQTQKDSIAGVSVDEEMANMVQFQQSYNAAARIFNVIDEMITTVISLGTGGG